METKRILTYANPLSIPDLPRGTDRAGAGDEKKTLGDYRSIADPSVLLIDGKWYLYPSYGMTYVSEDFVNWKYVPCNIPSTPGYSPAVVEYGGRYWMTRHSEGLYVSDTPTGPFEDVGPFILPDGSPLRPVDPAFFRDDDGAVYLYWFGCEGSPGQGGRSFTLGARLSKDDIRRIETEPVVINAFDPSHEWERFGADHQDDRWGWIEGQWMIRRGGRYYLIYAANGTEFPGYAMGAYYSDEGPLTGFVYQKRNPIVSRTDGLVRGGGHGSVVPAPDGSLWAFYTIPIAYNHIFERRIGMDRIEIDDSGELYCPRVTDTPQYAPGQMLTGSAGLRALTAYMRFSCEASSQEPGREGFLALDDSLMTCWLPREDDARPTLTVNLGAAYDVAATRVIWREAGLSYDRGALPGPFGYVIEVSPDGRRWVTALDASGNDVDLSVDYRAFDPVPGRHVRLTVTKWPRGLRPGVISFTAFGTREKAE